MGAAVLTGALAKTLSGCRGEADGSHGWSVEHPWRVRPRLPRQCGARRTPTTAAQLSPLGLLQLWNHSSRADARPAAPCAGLAATAEAPQGVPPSGCPRATSSLLQHLQDRAQPGTYIFPGMTVNYSNFILKTFQGERDPGTRSSTMTVALSQCHDLTFPVSHSGMGAGPWPLPAMGNRREKCPQNRVVWLPQMPQQGTKARQGSRAVAGQ